jgi:hypothetical protein
MNKSRTSKNDTKVRPKSAKSAKSGLVSYNYVSYTATDKILNIILHIIVAAF